MTGENMPKNMPKNMPENMPKNIVCISSTDWFPLPTRKQQIMSRLPKEHQILYVNPPITLLSPIKDRQTAFKLTAFFRGLQQVQDNIYVYAAPPVLPFGNVVRLINKVNQWWLSLFIKKQMKKLRVTKPLVWTYMPNSLELVNKLDYQALVYDCVDEHSAYQGFINKEQMRQMEKELIQAADLFFVTAPGLYESKKEYNKRTYLIPNGVNFELFNAVDREDTLSAAEVKVFQRPIIGFVGVIQEWIDLKLIEKIAVQKKDWSIVLVGPIGAGIKVDSLKRLPNVHFLGRKKPEELPSYIKAFDVCINPFRPSELTENVSPLKFYEYLATGKPIVTVDMPAVRQFADCVFIGADDDSFIAKIEQALTEDTPALKEKRIDKGQASSWENKVREITAIITKQLGELKNGTKI